MINEKICYLIAYIAEAVIALWYFEKLFARKRSMWQIMMATIIGYLLLYYVLHFDIIAANAVFFFIVHCFILSFGYYCAKKTTVLHSAFLSFVVTMAEVLVALFMSVFVQDFSAYTYNLTVTVVMATLGKLLYLVFAMIGAKVFTPHKHSADEPRMMTLFCLLPIFSAIISVFIVYIGLNSELTEPTAVMMIVNVFALLGVNLIFLMLYNYMQKAAEENLTLQLGLQKEEADAAYYQEVQKQAESQRIFIHDIKNHLRTIDGLAAGGRATEISDYIAKLESSIVPVSHMRICSDPILNIMLIRYSDECREKGISIQFDIRENCTSNMDAPSITTLYGNLLSNAVDAASTSREKNIELSVIRNAQQTGVLVSVVNSCDIAPIPNTSGGYRTNKMAGVHGVGLRSIERIVQKYNGISTMYYDKGKRKFHHIIQFPESGSTGKLAVEEISNS